MKRLPHCVSTNLFTKTSYQENYYIKNISHTKFDETISKAENESRSFSQIGHGNHGIEEGKWRRICHN